MSGGEGDRPRAEGPRRGLARLGIGQVLALSIGTLLAIAVAGVVFALVANAEVNRRQDELAAGIVPAQTAALGLERALLNQETGVRGYLLTAERQFLEPYEDGLNDESRAYRQLQAPGARRGARRHRAGAGGRATGPSSGARPSCCRPGPSCCPARWCRGPSCWSASGASTASARRW